MGIYAGNVKEEQENNQHYVLFFFTETVQKRLFCQIYKELLSRKSFDMRTGFR